MISGAKPRKFLLDIQEMVTELLPSSDSRKASAMGLESTRSCSVPEDSVPGLSLQHAIIAELIGFLHSRISWALEDQV